MGRIRGVILAFFGGLGIGLIMCRLFAYAPGHSLIFALSGTLGAVAGACGTGRSEKQGLCAMGAGVVLAGVLGAVVLPGYLLPLLNLGCCLLGLGALTATGYGFYGPLGVWSCLIAGVALLVAGHWGIYWQAGVLVAVVMTLVLTLDGFRDGSLRKSQHKNRSYVHIPNPSNIRRHSFLLVAIFFGIALLASLLCWGMQSLLVALFRGLFTRGNALYDAFVQWVEPIMEAFLLWLRSRLNRDTSSGGGGGGTTDGGWRKTSYVGSALATSLLIGAFIVLCGAIALGVGGLFLHQRLKKRESRETEAYEDFVEKLDHPGLFRRFRGRKGKQRLKDYDTPAMKIRFVFQQLLRKKQHQQGSVAHKTPNELLDVTVTDEATLVAAYNRVKYGHGQISPEELAAAKRYYDRL